MTARIICGDCLDVMADMDAGSVDAIVTDPPYGLAFMAKEWDTFTPGDSPMRRRPEMDAVNTGATRQGGRQRYGADYQKRQARDMRAFQDGMEEVFIAALRVAKPGAHLLAFGGTRTFHRLTCAIEDAGWEIRDCLGWVYGSGFPKSLDVSKAIDKMAGAAREIVGKNPNWRTTKSPIACPQSENPAHITAPATDAARQWSGWGTALKPAWEPIILARAPLTGTVAANVCEHGTGALNIDACRIGTDDDRARPPGRTSANTWDLSGRTEPSTSHPAGRWPANILHDGSDEVLGIFPNGSARFFYAAKASRSERGEGNVHPTVKPLALMRYLCRLITPPGGLVLDPFAGSGSTLIAAVAEGFEAVGIEKDAAYAEIARARLAPLLAVRALDTFFEEAEA